MSKTDDQLRSESAVNESRAEWSAGAVIFGLFLEVALATARSVELDVKPALENWGTVVADALIAMGVFCELLFGRRASHGNAELRRRSEKMVAELTVRAAEANEKALEAQLALEKYRKPWALPIWKHLARANTFSRFAATPYRIRTIYSHSEFLMAIRLKHSLDWANWLPISDGKTTPYEGIDLIDEFVGIDIRVDKSRGDEWLAAAQAIAEIFNGEEIEAEARVMESGTPNDAIYIYIGSKQ